MGNAAWHGKQIHGGVPPMVYAMLEAGAEDFIHLFSTKRHPSLQDCGKCKAGRGQDRKREVDR